MKTVQRIYAYQGKDIPASITYKRVRYLRLRYDVEKGRLRLSVPLFTSLRDIDAFVSRNLPKVLEKVPKKKVVYDGEALFLFGERIVVGELEEGELSRYYKKMGLPYLKQRVTYYSELMGITQAYKVRMREMKRTYGSNSRRTGSLTFQTRLMAFPKDIIDSVVVHELAHHFQFDHSSKFYDIVYTYCPDYKKRRKELIHDEFDRDYVAE